MKMESIPTCTSRDFVWALFSESQQKLLELVSNLFQPRMLWKNARDLGIGYWIRDETLFVTFST